MIEILIFIFIICWLIRAKNKAKNKAKAKKISNSITQIKPIIRNNKFKKISLMYMPDLKISKLPRDEEYKKNFSDFIVVDVETTGLSAKNDKIIQISSVLFQNFKPIKCMQSYINPMIPIPKEATNINNITDDMVKNAPTINQVYESFSGFINSEKIIIGHNIEFDLKFLYTNGIDLFEKKHTFYDTLAIARTRLKNNPYIYNFKLATLAKHYNINLKAHDALSDSIATGYLFIKLLSEDI